MPPVSNTPAKTTDAKAEAKDDPAKSNSDSGNQENTGHPTPVIRSAPEASTKNEVNVVQPDPSKYSGAYVQNSNGEEFGLCVVPEDPLYKTHKLRNDEHFWEGTKDEFKAQFEKK